MTSARVLRRIGLLAAAGLLAAGIGIAPLHAVDNNKSSTRAEKTKTKKATRKTGTQSESGHKSSGDNAASKSMPGYRPETLTGY